MSCYSGSVYAQEPRSFLWQGRRQPVAAIEARWRTPRGPAFSVRAESGQRFELDYDESQDRWLIRELPAGRAAPNHN